MALASHATESLAGHFGPWVSSLIDKQDVAAAVYVKARHATAFGRGLAAQRIDLEDLSEVHLTQYQDRRRRVRGPVCVATRQQERRESFHLLRDLRELGVCSAARVATTPTDDLAASFGHHLQRQQSVADPSIERHRTVARQFLVERLNRGAVDLSTVGAVDVIGFVQRQANCLTPPTVKCVINGLHSFLQYFQFRGDVVPELVAALPAVASWACTPAVPKAISAEHAQRAIDSCDLTNAIGLRDRAVVLRLARLGLRAREVISLRLKDCDWDRLGHPSGEERVVQHRLSVHAGPRDRRPGYARGTARHPARSWRSRPRRLHDEELSPLRSLPIRQPGLLRRPERLACHL